MIVFIPGYDEPTKANLAIGKQLIDGHLALVAQEATRNNLLDLLNKFRKESLFSMSHGKQDKLLDNNSEPAITIGDEYLFSNRITYAWACHTGTNFGKRISDHDGIWWGYTGKVTAPSISEPFRQKQEEVFRFIQNHFDKIKTPQEIIDMINIIKCKCDEMISIFDEIILSDTEDTMEIYSCSNHIWERLLVWHPLTNEIPLKHEKSKGVLLEL